MNKAYHEILSADYFNNLLDKVCEYTKKGECVLISAMYGLGNKTAFNFLSYQLKKSKSFNKVLTYDPNINTISLVRYIKNIDLSQKTLVIVRFLDQFENINLILEKIDSLRRKRPSNLTIIAITDYTGVTDPLKYTADTKPFFTQRLYLGPFSLNETKRMIDTFRNFYSWKIKDTSISQIYSLSGGIARFVKYICKEVVDENADITKYENLLNVSNLFELEYLSKVLIKVKGTDLKKLGLINSEGEIISLLLKKYFKNYNSDIIARLYPLLTESETRVFSYLLENEGQIVNPDKIAELMKMADEDFSFWAIYKLISRLKPKVKNNYRIKNAKGRGYFVEKIAI